MKRIVVSMAGLALLALPLFGLGLRGDGRVKTERRDLPAFSGVELSGVGELELRRGPRHRAEIRLDGNLLDRFETEVRGGVLRLGFERGVSVSGITELRIVLTLPELESLAVSGAGRVDLGEDFSGRGLSLELSGTGSVRGEIDYRELRAGISGAGSLELSGELDRLSLGISGSGSLEAPELEAREAEIGISGAGSVLLRVSELLRAELSGLGSVRYYGSPRVEERVSGLGRVERAGN